MPRRLTPKVILAPPKYLQANAWLRAMRQAVDITQAQLAAGSGVSKSSIKQYERGIHRCNADTKHALILYMEQVKRYREEDAAREAAFSRRAA